MELGAQARHTRCTLGLGAGAWAIVPGAGAVMGLLPRTAPVALCPLSKPPLSETTPHPAKRTDPVAGMSPRECSASSYDGNIRTLLPEPSFRAEAPGAVRSGKTVGELVPGIPRRKGAQGSHACQGVMCASPWPVPPSSFPRRACRWAHPWAQLPWHPLPAPGEASFCLSSSLGPWGCPP